MWILLAGYSSPAIYLDNTGEMNLRDTEHKLKIDRDDTDQLSPLDRIRDVEAEVASRVAAARQVAEAIVELAESELRLRPLADEIGELTHRVNALEHILIPRLEGERDYIEMALQERARDERFRLKLAKRLLQRRR